MKAPRLTARSVWVGALIVLGLAVSTWVGVPGGRDGRTSGVASAQATRGPRTRARSRSPATTASSGASTPITTRSPSSGARRRNKKVAEIPVGKSPGASRSPRRQEGVRHQHGERHGRQSSKRPRGRWSKTIRVGTEPFGCALTPNGTKALVTNQSSNTVSVINTATRRRRQDHPAGRPEAARHRDRRRRKEDLRDAVPRAEERRTIPAR